MDQPTLPQQAELSAMYGPWNAMGYMQGMNNQDLADQFRQQAFVGNQAKLLTDQQTYNQAEQMNPLLLQAKLADIGKTEIENQRNGLTLARDQANQSYELADIPKKWAAQASARDIQEFQDRATKMIQSGDPAQVKAGLEMYQHVPAIMAANRTAQAEMERQKEQSRSHIEGIKLQNAAQERLEKMRIDAGKYDKAKRASLSVWESISSGKLSYERAAVVLRGYANQTKDPAEKEFYLQEANNMAMENRNARSAAAIAGKPDLEGAADIPTLQQPAPFNGGGPTMVHGGRKPLSAF